MKRLAKFIGAAAVLALLALVSIPASPVEKQPEWKGRIVKEGDVTVVQNPEEPLYAVPPLVLKEDWSVGGANADANSAFSGARTLAVDDAENVFVLDSRESHVRVFDRSGKFVMTFGQMGQGPGDLQYSYTICFNPVTKELVINGPGSRLSFFSSAGKFLRSLPVEVFNLFKIEADSQGNYFFEEFLRDPSSAKYMIKKYDPNLKLIAQFAQAPGPKPGARFRPYRPEHSWRVDKQDNLIYGYSEDYEILIYSPANKLLKKIRRDYVPIEVTEADKVSFSQNPAARANLDFPKYRSAYINFVVGDQGSILVSGWERSVDLFDPQGRYIAKIPASIYPIVWKNDKIYSIEADKDGNTVVKKYAVTWLKTQ